MPVFVDKKEKEPLNLELIDHKELKGDNEKKIKVGRSRKALKRVRNMFRKYFKDFSCNFFLRLIFFA